MFGFIIGGPPNTGGHPAGDQPAPARDVAMLRPTSVLTNIRRIGSASLRIMTSLLKGAVAAGTARLGVPKLAVRWTSSHGSGEAGGTITEGAAGGKGRFPPNRKNAQFTSPRLQLTIGPDFG
jgi:hypothetical protein